MRRIKPWETPPVDRLLLQAMSALPYLDRLLSAYTELCTRLTTGARLPEKLDTNSLKWIGVAQANPRLLLGGTRW